MNLSISNQERIDLKRLLDTMECENNTDTIRKVKHSSKIQQSVMDLVNYKKNHTELLETDQEQYDKGARDSVPFLYENYADIFKKILRDEIDFQILSKLLYVLGAIEEEKVDQHEGSVLVGRILKELYLDSAVKHGENLDKKYKTDDDNRPATKPEKLISWRQYKENSTI